MADLLEYAAGMYELARADAEYARESWVAAGRPLELESHHGGVHPLRKALVEADDRVARRARDLAGLMPRRAGPGRPPGVASAADRSPKPVRLKVAG